MATVTSVSLSPEHQKHRACMLGPLIFRLGLVNATWTQRDMPDNSDPDCSSRSQDLALTLLGDIGYKASSPVMNQYRALGICKHLFFSLLHLCLYTKVLALRFPHFSIFIIPFSLATRLSKSRNMFCHSIFTNRSPHSEVSTSIPSFKLSNHNNWLHLIRLAFTTTTLCSCLVASLNSVYSCLFVLCDLLVASVLSVSSNGEGPSTFNDGMLVQWFYSLLEMLFCVTLNRVPGAYRHACV